MSATVNESTPNDAATQTAAAAVPKRITNAQTVCNERNAKGKLCNGHLKQLNTAGEAAEVHLRGDDVLSKCQTCGTLYMGPPLGHVRDPLKQHRFVEAELTALLQAAGGTLPVVKKNEKGVFVIVEPGAESTAVATKPAPTAAKPAPAATAGVTPASASAKPAVPPAKPAAPAPSAAKPAEHKAGAEPNRQLFKRSTYVGVVDTGPVPGETFQQKVERLRKVSAAAKQRAEEGGGEPSTSATAASAAPAMEVIETAATEPEVLSPTEAQVEAASALAEAAMAPSEVAAAAQPAAPAPAATKSGQPDRTLMKRYTYCGVVDTGPVAGETFEQKVERLRAVSAAAKQRADEGGGAH
jgi:hypothetical protein